MGETKPKKMVSRSVAIALGICILLIAGLGGAMAYYTMTINDKDTQINSANNTINQLNATIADENNTIASLNINITNLRNEKNQLQTGRFAGAPTYTVYLLNGTYCAEDAYGDILGSSTDAYEVIQPLLNSAATADVNIYFAAGTFSLSTGLAYAPTSGHTLMITGAGQGLGLGGTTLYCSANSVPVFQIPNTAAVDYQLNIENLNFQVKNGYSTQAIFINQSGELYFNNVDVMSLPISDIPASGSVGIQLGKATSTLSGDTKEIDNTEILGFETGILVAADWVTLNNMQTYYSNEAAYDFEGSPIKPIMNRCHAYLAGGPYVIYDNRSEGGEAYLLDINDFYSEAAGTQSGFNAVTSIYYNAQQGRVAVSNFATYTAWDVAVPPEYGGTLGAYLIANAGSQTVYMPTTMADWNRNSWSNTPSSLNVSVSYRNVNMATMHIVIDYELPPASGANSTVILGMYNNNPSGGGVYTPFYAKANSQIGQTYAIDGQLTLDVPPGWWFFVSANLQSMITQYVITYTDF